jgi:chromosome segregation ATPase
LNILTKSLIILLTLSSLFLCGIVVQFVTSADNYKQALDKRKTEIESLKQQLADTTKKLEDETAKGQLLADSKNKEITSLTARINQLDDKAAALEREKNELFTRVQSWVTITQNLTDSTNKQRQLFENTFSELNKTKTDLLTEQKKLDETSVALLDREALIEMLRTDSKRLVEEKTALEKKLNRLLQPYGQKVTVEKPITEEKDTAIVTPVETAQIALKGKITAVDLKNNLAKISIGSSDGIKKGSQLHVTRGSNYICDIKVIDVAPDESVGSLELIQQEPKAGDTVATNL